MILGTYAGGQAPRTDYNQTDSAKADYLVGREQIAGHIANKENPHGVTAEQVGAAPGDYGLGGVSKQLTSADDLNNIKANGWYQWNYNDKPKNVPSSSGTVYMSAMRVTVGGATCLQEVFDTSDSTLRGGHVQWVIYGGIVFEWEWVNPPMIAGTEYRTIERWKGKPVYTMLVDCGYLPNASTKDTQYRSNGVVDEPLEWYGVYANEQAAVGNDSFDVLVTRTIVRIVTKSDKSAFTAQIAVKYTKN